MFNGMDNTNSTTHANVSMFWSQHREKKIEGKIGKIYNLNSII